MYNYKNILKAIDLFNKYKSKNKVSKELCIPRTTIGRWINKYQNNLSALTDVINKTHKPVTKKLNISNKIIQYVQQLYDINPYYTRTEIIISIKDKFNIKISLKKMCKIVKKIGYTSKKCKYLVIKNKKYIDQLKINRNDFTNKIKKLDVNKIISIDESGFNSFYRKNMKGHSKKGIPVFIPVNEKEFKNQSLLMAVTTSNIINYNIYQSKVNSIIFKDFIISIINKPEIKNYTFIFDNVSFHKNKETLKLITDSGNDYLFVPAYSPNNNPIENIFGIIKTEFSKQIINDIVKKNIVSKSETKIKNKNNKTLILKESKERIYENTKEIKENYVNKINNYIIDKNKNKILSKKEKNELIKNEKKIIREEKNKILYDLREKEKKDIKNKIKNTNMSNIIVFYINKTITKIKSEYTHEKLLTIFNHAFQYNYDDIEKEIRDRIHFLRN